MKKRDLLIMLKSKKCTDCGLEYPWYCMDFDHVGEKKECISKINKSMVLEEIKKCELVCSNCHRKRTYSKKQYSAIGSGRPAHTYDYDFLLGLFNLGATTREAANRYQRTSGKISHTQVARIFKKFMNKDN